jgi:hypothetical protein
MPEDKLPIPQLKLPRGFKIEVYASGIANARSLRLGDKGTVRATAPGTRRRRLAATSSLRS